MQTLTYDQLKRIPWSQKSEYGLDVPLVPNVDEICSILKTPFIKRNLKYSLFYTWYEIINAVGKEPVEILDAACGRGQIAQILSFKGHKVTACDLHDYFCADKSKIKYKNVDLDLDWPYPANSFNIVINSTALHYLRSSEHFFYETQKVLKPNGQVIFSIPNISNLGGRYYFLKTGKIVEYSSAILDRKNFIYPAYIFELLKSLNFDIIEIRGSVPIVNLKIKCFNFLLGNKFIHFNDSLEKYASILVIKAKLTKK